VAETIRTISSYGSKTKYEHELKGVNSRLDEIQASLLRVKLKNLDAEIISRRKVVEYYLKNIKAESYLLPYPEKDNVNDAYFHVWHLFVLRASNREKIKEILWNNGIQTLIHYPIAPHKQKALKEFGGIYLPLTEKIHREVFSIPLSSVLDMKDAEKVVEVLNGI
jgi:dTDP-4-amino-4,6-dideoxygalactose transaminase